MKTSNKLMLTAVIILLISMIAYDFALRAEYRKGDFRKPFYGMEKDTTLTGFTSIENRVADHVSVGVLQDKNTMIYNQHDFKENFKIYKNGSVLIIDVNEKKVKKLTKYHQSNVVIFCPSIEKLITEPDIQSKPSETDYAYENFTTTLKGFNLQKLQLNIGKLSTVILEGNKINQLQAVVGENSAQKSNLTIRSDNQINSAKIDVLGKNELRIENPIIVKKQFTVSDSATISMGGNFHNQLKINN